MKMSKKINSQRPMIRVQNMFLIRVTAERDSETAEMTGFPN